MLDQIGTAQDAEPRRGAMGYVAAKPALPHATNTETPAQAGRREANYVMEAKLPVPPATNTNLDDLLRDEGIAEQCEAEAKRRVAEWQASPHANDTEIGGRIMTDGHFCTAPAGEGLTALADPIPMAKEVLPSNAAVPSEAGASVPATTIAELRELQRQRQFCIVSQSRCDRACEAFIARYLGYTPDMDAKDRAAVWKQATALRKGVEAGGEGLSSVDNQIRYALSACTPIILNSAGARDAWDKLRSQVEKQMRKTARALPAWAWVESVAGFGDLGLAIIVGETGDLANYATKERVWKRLGLAVISGERQQRKAGTEAAAAHGFNPKRRAEIWAIADSMFRHQWAGAKEGQEARAKGPYGAIYGRRKAHTITREGWTPKHRDNDARRIMAKALVEDLWRVWSGKPPLAGLDA